MSPSLTQSAQPVAPQPAAPLLRFLDGSLDRTVESATAWLTKAGIDGTAAFDEARDIVITLPTSAAVDQLATVLLDPCIRAHTAADDLVELLSSAALVHHVGLLGTHAVEVTLADGDLGAAIQFAALLGAGGIDDGLTLSRPRGMRRLAERLQWLVTGAVGTTVHTDVRPGYVHDPDHLTIDQARHLTQRLVLAATGTDRAACRAGTGGAA
ncbi:hypothetical protein [Streptomyces ziwulingensis]|uniref:Uncharacterized protein n=1 Tax=Streptomyces ziwulingensis TaxID=1045501 RepID=A0ABP9AND0_9ACTN